MSKFEVGDKVVRVDASGGFEEFKVGEVRTVTSVGSDWFNVGDRTLYDKRAELFEEQADTPTAESLRSRYLLSKQEAKAHSISIQNLEKEQEGIVAQLKEMGFSLYEAPVNEERISLPALDESGAQENDYKHPTSWKSGMYVECICDEYWSGNVVSGGIYKISQDYCPQTGLQIIGERDSFYVKDCLEDFKFHNIGIYKCDA